MLKKHTSSYIVAVLALCLSGLFACGEDTEAGGGEEGNPPVISNASLTCGPFAGDGDPKIDGDILLRIEVVASDEDGDLTGVSANYDGALLVLTDAGSDTFVYEQGGTFNEIARCSGSESVTIRAIDALGNVAELRDEAIMR